MKFTKEQLEKAKQAKSAEELLALAKENGIELTEEEAKLHFALWHKEELADEELSNVNGGSQCVGGKTYSSDYPYLLITTAGNSCGFYDYNPDLSFDSGTCYQCLHCHTKGLTMYCERRSRDCDPFR